MKKIKTIFATAPLATAVLLTACASPQKVEPTPTKTPTSLEDLIETNIASPLTVDVMGYVDSNGEFDFSGIANELGYKTVHANEFEEDYVLERSEQRPVGIEASLSTYPELFVETPDDSKSQTLACLELVFDYQSGKSETYRIAPKDFYADTGKFYKLENANRETLATNETLQMYASILESLRNNANIDPAMLFTQNFFNEEVKMYQV
ncbi:hypothetical protein IKF15_03865 [Candidatus Saccharibacteria bacterium]|nr:hypothetical protein [Candidatus Saccharibacteria bacterium]